MSVTVVVVAVVTVNGVAVVGGGVVVVMVVVAIAKSLLSCEVLMRIWIFVSFTVGDHGNTNAVPADPNSKECALRWYAWLHETVFDDRTAADF